jgi:putative hydrolase of the HAD superfamily
VRPSPSAVIFDYGNVLSTAQPAADTQAMADILDVPPARFTELYWRFRIPYDAASLTPEEYWNTVADSAERGLAGEQITTLIEIDSRSWSYPAPATPEWSRELRAAGLRTALLSNMPATVRDYVLGCSWLPQFDARVFSCEAGVCKPAPEIYADCLKRLGAQPGEVLFLDDREPNIRAAEALGLHAVWFRNASEAALEIRRRFHLPLALPVTLE